MTAAKDRWISLAQAREISGHKSNGSLSDWCRRFNAGHPKAKVRRRNGFVEEHSLRRALNTDEREFDREQALNDALASLHMADVLDVRRTA